MSRQEYTTDEDFALLFEAANSVKKNVKVPRYALVAMLMDYGCLRASELGLANRVKVINPASRPRTKKATAGIDNALADL